MFILSETDRRLINLDQIRSLEVQHGKGWYAWEIVAVFDEPGIYYRIADFDKYHSNQGDSQNREEAMSVLKELCYTIANTEDRNAVIDMNTIGEDSIYNR